MIRALFLLALAGCSERPIYLPAASGDLGVVDLAMPDLAASSRSCGLQTCGPTQVCVHPDCCVFCLPYTQQVGDGGICPSGTIEHGPCSNIQGPCSQPCTPDPEFCVDAPTGCAALDPFMYCRDQGQEGGSCSDRDLYCIICF